MTDPFDPAQYGRAADERVCHLLAEARVLADRYAEFGIAGVHLERAITRLRASAEEAIYGLPYREPKPLVHREPIQEPEPCAAEDASF